MKLKQVGSNKTELRLGNGNVVLFSYETPVAALIEGEGYIRTEQKYSVTTSKHITQWLQGVNARVVPQSQLDMLAVQGQ